MVHVTAGHIACYWRGFDFSHWCETMTVAHDKPLILVRTGLAKIEIAP